MFFLNEESGNYRPYYYLGGFPYNNVLLKHGKIISILKEEGIALFPYNNVLLKRKYKKRLINNKCD